MKTVISFLMFKTIHKHKYNYVNYDLSYRNRIQPVSTMYKFLNC